jgi:RNA polymerase sigma-70 factor (ECF subfamily)
LADSERDSVGHVSLDAWVLNTLPRALYYARSLLGRSADADDLVHDCYCRLLARSSRYDLLHEGTRLLYRSITNACIDRSRKSLKTVSLHSGDEGTFLDVVDEAAQSPAAAIERQELLDAVAGALAELPLAQRAALELKSMGYSLSEIAEAVEVTESYAGVLVHRARRAVAEYLTKTYREESA